MLAAHLVALLILVGCTSPQVANFQMAVNEKPARPNRILVHDFAAVPSDIPSDAPVGARLSPGPSLSAEQIAMDRQLGVDMTAQLVTAIREMGLPAERALPGTIPQGSDVVVRGCLVSMHETNAARRFTVGLDPRASEFLTMLESLRITQQGLGHALGTSDNPTGIIATSGMKTDKDANPRPALGAWAKRTVKEISDDLKVVFQEKGWIN
jgi:hypothetical protein